MRKWIVVGAVAVALLVIAGQGQHGVGIAPPTPTVAAGDHASQAGYPYPARVEASFRRNFTNSPGMGDCALKATEQRYSYDDFVSISHAYGGTNTLPPSLQAIVLACAQSLQ